MEKARFCDGREVHSAQPPIPFIILKGGIRDSACARGCWKQGGLSRILPTLGSGLPRLGFLGFGSPSLTAACATHGAAFSPLQVLLAAAGAAHRSPSGC